MATGWLPSRPFRFPFVFGRVDHLRKSGYGLRENRFEQVLSNCLDNGFFHTWGLAAEASHMHMMRAGGSAARRSRPPVGARSDRQNTHGTLVDEREVLRRTSPRGFGPQSSSSKGRQSRIPQNLTRYFLSLSSFLCFLVMKRFRTGF
jgi:hypothetical protein